MTIRLTLNKINPLVLPVIFAKKLGYFEQYQLDVELTIAKTFQFHQKDAFLTGDVDAMMGDLTFFFDYLSHGKQAVVTSTLTRTIQLVVNEEQENKKKKNLTIGVARKGLFPFFLATDLKKVLIAPKITWIDNTYERMAAMKKHTIDGLVAIEPFVHNILEEIPAKVIWHSKNSDKTMVMWCFDQQFYETHTQEVRHFHYALETAAMQFNQWCPEEKVRQCMRQADYTQHDAQAMAAFTFEPQKNYAASDFQQLADFLYETGQIPQLYQAEKYIVPIF